MYSDDLRNFLSRQGSDYLSSIEKWEKIKQEKSKEAAEADNEIKRLKENLANLKKDEDKLGVKEAKEKE